MKSFAWASSMLAVATLFLVGAGDARAQSAFCSAALEDFSGDGDFGIPLVRQHCQIGDTIVVPAEYIAAIALACDFSKSIVRSGNVTVCVLAKPRPRH